MAPIELVGPRTAAAAGDRSSRNSHKHTVQFYEHDASVSAAAAEFLVRGLNGRQHAVVIATPEHAAGIAAGLASAGCDVGAALMDGRLRLVDARATLAGFMIGDVPDVELFTATMDAIMGATGSTDGRLGVRAYGEMVDVLWREGNTQSAIRLEDLWNELIARHEEVSLFCAYSMASFYRESDADDIREICDRHTHIIPAGRTTREGPAPDGELAVLRERTRSYAVEVRQREQLEQRLRETVIALQEREEDLRDVLENAAEGIHLVGPDGVIRWANDAELQMLGYARDEYVGHNIAEFHADEDVCRDILGRLARGETLRHYEARLRRKDGEVRYGVVNSNVRWRNGEFVHTRCFTTDITDARMTSVERERALDRERTARLDAERARADAVRAQALAEQANRAKSEFLAVMSHELRTPLNAIGGYAELMEMGIHGPVSSQQRDALDRIQRSQRMLLGLINEVLNYTRIETGNVQYTMVDVAIGDALRVTEALLAPQLRAKGLRYECRDCPDMLTCRADDEKFQQIMLNLLTNALKFTERGGSISVEPDVVGSDVVIRVRDTGIGIAADKIDQIFEPFVQVDANYTRTRDGVGLGLAISRDLARGMGGELTVESAPGKGSVFALRLARGA